MSALSHYDRSMRRGSVLLLVALAVQIAVGASLLEDGRARPDRAPVMIVGPDVVAPVVARRANSMAGAPFQAIASTSADAGSRALAEGEVVAVLVIDLSADEDVLRLASTNGADLDAGLASEVRAVEAALGRRLDLEQISVSSLDRRAPYVVAAGCVVLGLVASAVSCFVRGPADLAVRELAARLRRHLAFAALVGAAVVAGVWSAGGGTTAGRSVAAWFALGLLLTLSASVSSSALMALAGVGGVVAASTLFAVTAAPLARLQHPLLLDDPWALITSWLPHGAGLDLAQALAVDGAGSVRSWTVLMAYLAVSTVVLLVAQRERTRPISTPPTSGAGSLERRQH